MHILEIEDLCKNYQGFSLKNVSFKLPRGFIMGFIGPNGAGKTTTIKLIMNLIKRDKGQIKVCELDNITQEKSIKKQIGFVYDENHWYEELTPEEMKKIIAPFYPGWDENAFYRHIKGFELPLHKKIKTLSKGMKMKYSLALALSHHAELLLMDEPTSGLDPVFRSELLDLLREYLADENKGVLFSTHVTSDLDKIADYVTLLDRGEVLFSLSREVLMEKSALVKGEKKYLDSEMRQDLLGLRESSFGFEALTRDAAKIRRRFNDAVLIERPTLEEIMLYTIRGNKECKA